MITVAALTPSLDLTCTVAALRPGEIHRVPEMVRCAGGKALNMARAAARMGAGCRVVAVLGGATGRTVGDLLADEGLDVVAVPTTAETRTCVSVAVADTHRLTEFYQDAPALGEGVWAAFADAVAVAVGGTPGWLSVSGRAPAGAADRIAELVRLGRGAGLPVAVDTHSEALPGTLVARPSLVKINRAEAAGLLGVPLEADLLGMATALRNRSGALVVLTDGTDGALAVDADAAWHAHSTHAVGDYPVGSGDAFLGGLLAAREQGADLTDSLRTATGCAVANAQVPGPGRFERTDAEAAAAAVVLRRLA